jgi:general nucleoside transport system ATP-binding protein
MIVESSAALLEAHNITKIYPGGTLANDAVNLRVEPGKVHAIVGENGAGKSTLMKILFGLERPDSGTLKWLGEQVRWNSPSQAINAGVGMVFQHFSLVPSFSVAENVVLGSEPRRGLKFDRKVAIEKVGELAARYGLRVDPKAAVSSLPVGQQQRVEILKVLYRDARLLILDEPSAVLTPQEVAELFSAIRTLVASGRTVIFIAHKLPEVLAISNTITVMRAGRVVGEISAAEASETALTRMMVQRDVLLKIDRPGRDLAQKEAPRRTASNPVLQTRNISASNDQGVPTVRSVSLEVHPGEILGLAGVEGNGQAEFLEVLTGLRAASQGKVFLESADITALSTRARRQRGIASIPEDRLVRGLAPEATIAENLIATRLHDRQFVRRGVLNLPQISASARELTSRFGIRAPNVTVPMASLSGGNMQKTVVARELAKTPKLLCVAQPTRGVDIGATEFIWRTIINARNAGAAVILTSTDLSELLALSDRIAVFFRGEIAGLFENPAQLTQEELGACMLGLGTGVPLPASPAPPVQDQL